MFGCRIKWMTSIYEEKECDDNQKTVLCYQFLNIWLCEAAAEGGSICKLLWKVCLLTMWRQTPRECRLTELTHDNADRLTRAPVSWSSCQTKSVSRCFDIFKGETRWDSALSLPLWLNELKCAVLLEKSGHFVLVWCV